MFADENTRGPLIAQVLLLVALLGAAFLAGRQTAPTDTDVRRSQGVPMGYAHTADGARAAALTFASVRARTVLLEPRRRMALLGAFATDRFAQIADREDRERDLAPLAGQEGALFQIAGLGTRLNRLEGDVAVVTVWLVQVFAADETVASFSTQQVRLVWGSDDWRLDAQQDAPEQAIPDVVQRPQREATRTLVRGLTAPTYGRP